MLSLNTLNLLQQYTSFELVRIVVSIEAIRLSTKTKAKDFLPDSYSFRDRVIKKFTRTHLCEDESTAIIIFDLYDNLLKYEEANAILEQSSDTHNPHIEQWSNIDEVIKKYHQQLNI